MQEQCGQTAARNGRHGRHARGRGSEYMLIMSERSISRRPASLALFDVV